MSVGKEHSALKTTFTAERKQHKIYQFQRRSMRVIAYHVAMLIIPIVTLGLAARSVTPLGTAWVAVSAFFAMYVLVGLSVTIGLHRLLTHGSFETFAWVRYAFAIVGSMSAQESLFDWVSGHRVHHMYADHDFDPHSPHAFGAGIRNRVRGLLHAHFGWLVSKKLVGSERHIPDLLSDATMVWIDKWTLV